MPSNSGGRTSARRLGRTAPRFSVTRGAHPTSTSALRRATSRLTNVIFKHPGQARAAEFDVGRYALTISPLTGAAAGGTAIIVNGDNFFGATGMTLGGVAVTSFVVKDDQTITAVTGAHAAGAVTAVVTNTGFGETKLLAFTYT